MVSWRKAVNKQPISSTGSKESGVSEKGANGLGGRGERMGPLRLKTSARVVTTEMVLEGWVSVSYPGEKIRTGSFWAEETVCMKG